MVDKETGEFGLLSVIMSEDSVYAVPIGNSYGFVVTLSLMVIEVDGSKILMAMKMFLYFIGGLTEFSVSMPPNSMVIGVT